MIENNVYNVIKVLCVLLNQQMYCIMSLEGRKIRCVAFLCGPQKAGRGLI